MYADRKIKKRKTMVDENGKTTFVKITNRDVWDKLTDVAEKVDSMHDKFESHGQYCNKDIAEARDKAISKLQLQQGWIVKGVMTIFAMFAGITTWIWRLIIGKIGGG